MAEFSTIYDGKNSAVRLPDLDKTEKALSRSADLQIRGEEMKLDKSLKDKERLLDTMKTVPLSFHNEMLMTRQAYELEKYKNLGASLYAKYGTDLPITKQIELGNAKSALEQKQKTWQAESETAQRIMDILSKDNGHYYDHDLGITAYKKWLKDPENNRFDESALSVAPQSMGGWLRTQAKNMPASTNPVLINGRWVDQRIVSDDMKKEVIFEGLKDEAKLKGVIADFDEWTRTAPQHEVIALLDKNGDGVVSPEERTVANSGARFKDSPIVQWAMSNPNYLKQMDQDEGVSKNIQRTSIGSGSNDSSWASLKIGNGKAINYQPSDRMSVTLGSSDYSTYHVIPEWPTMTIPTTNVEIQTPQGNKEKTTVRSIAVQPTGYDEDKDEFTFIAKSNYKGGGTMGTGDQIAIKRQYVPREFDNFEILVNGQRIKIKDLKREQPQKKTGALDNL